MIDQTLLSPFSGYGYREESISFFEKIRKQGRAATASCHPELRQNSLGRFRLVPIEAALAADTSQTLPSFPKIFESRLYFYHYPKSIVEHCSSSRKYFGRRTVDLKFLLRFSLSPWKKWIFYPDRALVPGEGSYFVLPDFMAGKTVVAPHLIEVFDADLLWRSFSGVILFTQHCGIPKFQSD
jgi:hypothetical protein